MKRKRLSFTILACLSVLLPAVFTSCSSGGDGIESVPFQETEDGQWGMISPSGEVLFSDEFKSRPTVAREGRFFVQAKSGMWELYDATEKPKKLGEYVHATAFRDGVALVTEKGKHVSIINPDGEVVKELDKIEGKEVEYVSQFKNGYAIFITTDGLMGAVDPSGKCVLKPEYVWLKDCSDGKFLAVKSKYKQQLADNEKDKIKVSVLNTSGETLFEFSVSKYEDFGGGYEDGHLAVAVKRDGDDIWGIIDDKGEYVVKPTAKVKRIGEIKGDCFTYYNGEGWGLMNFEGETLIRAKYESLLFDTDNRLIATVEENDKYRYKYIDKEDNEVGDDTYHDVTKFSWFDGKHAFVRLGDNEWAIIDGEGKTLEKLPDMSDISLNEGDYYVQSDYIDLNKFVDAFGLTADGAMGLTWQTTAQEAVQAQVQAGSASGTSEHPAGTPWWYDYTSQIRLSKTVEGAQGQVTVKFSGVLSRQTYRTERVVDYEGYYYTYYHNEQIPTGYVWNDVSVESFHFAVPNDGRMRGKLRQLYKVLYEKFKGMGTVEKENGNAAVISLRNGRRALVAMAGDNVQVYWGAVSSDVDIDRYKDVREDDGTSPYESTDTDSVACDFPAVAPAVEYENDSVCA